MDIIDNIVSFIVYKYFSLHRVAFLNHGSSINNVLTCGDVNPLHPSWICRGNAKGFVIQNRCGYNKFNIICVGNGKLSIVLNNIKYTFEGLDNNIEICPKCNFISFKVNGLECLKKSPLIVDHDNFLELKFDVSDGDILTIEYEKENYYNKNYLRDILSRILSCDTYLSSFNISVDDFLINTCINFLRRKAYNLELVDLLFDNYKYDWWGLFNIINSFSVSKYSLIDVYKLAYKKIMDYHCASIGIGCKFLNRPSMPHGILGVFISGRAKIGLNCIIYQDVTIGSNLIKSSKNYGYPVIGNNVFIGAGAKIIGGVTVGNNVKVGANAVVVNNVPDNTTVVPSATRLISPPHLKDRV